MNLEEKERRLEEILIESAPAMVAFSGGVDSSYLAWKAHAVLGDHMTAVTAESASVPSHQRRLADRVIREFGIPHKIVHSEEIGLEEYNRNDANRCFHCKNEVYARLRAVAAAAGSSTVLDGLNADDLGDYRPGRKAALKHGVRSPLMEAELSKNDIRELSRRAGLPTADEPASACLASRFPYGVKITEEKLKQVDQGEELLREMGFRIFRVRHHESLVRIELGPDDLKKALNPETASALASSFKNFGYQFVTLDLEGYRTGSANEVLSDLEKQKFNI